MKLIICEWDCTNRLLRCKVRISTSDHCFDIWKCYLCTVVDLQIHYICEHCFMKATIRVDKYYHWVTLKWYTKTKNRSCNVFVSETFTNVACFLFVLHKYILQIVILRTVDYFKSSTSVRRLMITHYFQFKPYFYFSLPTNSVHLELLCRDNNGWRSHLVHVSVATKQTTTTEYKTLLVTYFRRQRLVLINYEL